MQILTTFIEQQKKDFYKQFNDKLYVTAFNVNTKSDCVFHNYTSNNDLLSKLLYSTYIPFFSNDTFTRDGYIDAFLPHFFQHNNYNILFLNLTTAKKIFYSFNLSEKNTSFKTMSGLLDIHLFYSTKVKTDLCSIVNKWNVYDKIWFSFRCYITYIIKQLITYIIFLKDYYQEHNEEFKSYILNIITNNIRNYMLMTINY